MAEVIARACYAFGLLLAFVAGMWVPCPAAMELERDYLAGAIIHQHDSPDPMNRFFDLAIASDLDGESNGGIPHVGVITAKESKLADWLSDHNGKRVALLLRAGGTLSRDGQLAAQWESYEPPQGLPPWSTRGATFTPAAR